MWPFKPTVKLHFPKESYYYLEELAQHIQYIKRVANDIGIMDVNVKASHVYTETLVSSFVQLTDSLIERMKQFKPRIKINVNAEVPIQQLNEFAIDIATTHNLDISQILPCIQQKEIHDELVQWYHLTGLTHNLDGIMERFEKLPDGLLEFLKHMPLELTENDKIHGAAYRAFLTSVNELADSCIHMTLLWIHADRDNILYYVSWLEKHGIGTKV